MIVNATSTDCRNDGDTAPVATALRRVALFGGGTGGHLVPGLALVEQLKRRHPGCRITLFRTRRAIEETVLSWGDVESLGIDLGQPGRHPLGLLRFTRQCVRAMAGIGRSLKQESVQVAVGLGGYPSIPGILAARLRRVPLILLEQNAIPGRVNRFLAPLADRVACSEAETAQCFGSLDFMSHPVQTGNPLRANVLAARTWRLERSAEERRLAANPRSKRVLLVMGGSQGAHAINRAVVDALASAPRYRERVFCVHIAGAADREWVETAYREAGWEARVSAFESELPRWMARADLVVARAGGTSVAEFAALGLPAILVPYPGHRDHHQERNAAVLERRGAARTVLQDDFHGERVLDCLDLLFRDQDLDRMGARGLASSRVDGADRVIDLMERLARPPGSNPGKCLTDS